MDEADDWVWVEGKTVRELSYGGVIKPGMLVEVRDGKRKKQLLVGHVNVLFGVCDDCTEVSSEARVLRYRQVWRP